MKMNLLALAAILFAFAPTAAPAADNPESDQPSYQLSSVELKGTLLCDEKVHSVTHEKTHECDLQFLDEKAGEKWKIRNSSRAKMVHQSSNGPTRVAVAGKSSPRFLLGGSYMELERIETIR